jgi:membrane-associated phospholipid phosphatase
VACWSQFVSRIKTAFGLLLLLGVPHCAIAQSYVAAPTERPISWSGLTANIASDQKQIWLFPVRVARGKNWKAVVAVTAVTAGLVALDPVLEPYFRRTSDFGRFNAVFSSSNTRFAIAAVPVSLYLTGLVGKNTYARNTALLAGEAIVGAELLTSAMKNVSHRLRPVAIPSYGNLADTWFRDKGYTLSGAGSFPSGHTIAAFSVATVFAQRYRAHRWVPYVAYGLAGAVGFSRVSLLSHFPSDVFMGAALGYSISRFAVLR